MPPTPTTSTKTLARGEVWNVDASAFNTIVNQGKSFIDPVEWSVDDPTLLSLSAPTGDKHEHTQVSALKQGSTVLHALSEGEEHLCTVTIEAPFDEIRLAWAKVSG